jgi:glycoprotein endo-alpha-1,2-mannosidase
MTAQGGRFRLRSSGRAGPLLAVGLAVLGGLWTANSAQAARLAYVPVADAYVRSDAPSSNFGTASSLRVDGSPPVRSYLRFSIGSLPGPVAKATLRIYPNSSQRTGVTASSVASTSWSETGITYANAPAIGTRRGSSGAVAAGTWTSVDVTNAVRGSGLVSFALTTASTTAVSLASREAANKPQLVIETASSAPPLQIGAYFYTWYGSSGRHWQDGYVRRALTTPQRPAHGEYDSRSPTTIAQQFAWAQQSGVDYFISSWWGANSYEDISTRDYVLKSSSTAPTKISLLYESLALLPHPNGLITFDPNVEAKLVSDFDYLARTYFADPNYLRINGRPVVFLYVTRIWRGNYAHAITTLRATIKQRYGIDLYLIGDEVDWDGTPNGDRIRLFDAITAYTMYSDLQTPGWPDTTGFLAGVQSRYQSFKATASAHGVAFVPNALPQFNDRGVRLSANHYVLPPETRSGTDGSFSLFSRFLDLSAQFLDPTIRTLTITSWNEWHEDTQVEPTAPAAPSTTPSLYTQGYTYISYEHRLLNILRAFSEAHGG